MTKSDYTSLVQPRSQTARSGGSSAGGSSVEVISSSSAESGGLIDGVASADDEEEDEDGPARQGSCRERQNATTTKNKKKRCAVEGIETMVCQKECLVYHLHHKIRKYVSVNQPVKIKDTEVFETSDNFKDGRLSKGERESQIDSFLKYIVKKTDAYFFGSCCGCNKTLNSTALSRDSEVLNCKSQV